MKCQILPVFHNGIQGNLEGECSNFSEKSLRAFYQATLQLSFDVCEQWNTTLPMDIWTPAKYNHPIIIDSFSLSQQKAHWTLFTSPD